MRAAFRGSGHPGAPVDRNPGAADRIPPDDRHEGLRLKLTGLAYLTVWELVRRLPEGIAYGLGDVLARLWHRTARSTRARVRNNLRRVVEQAQLERIVRESFRSYARYWVEAFRAADVAPDDVLARTSAVDVKHLDAVLERGQGAVVLLAHHGSWDTAARWAESAGYHLAVVAEVVRPRMLFRRFVKLREAIGLEVVPLQRGGSVTGRLTEVAKANHLIGLLTDRDLTGKAPVVTFFGEEARIPIGPVVVAQRSGALIVPMTMVQRPGRRWEVIALPPFDVTDMAAADASQRVATALESLIRLAPEQWHAFQPVWLTDLPPHRRGDWRPETSGV